MIDRLLESSKAEYCPFGNKTIAKPNINGKHIHW